jgi:hypothetical protein
MTPDVGGIPVRPGPFNPGTTRRGMPCRGHAAVLATGPTGLCHRRQPEIMQERSGRLDAREVSPFGHPGHRDRAWDAPAGLERRDDGREAPGVPRRMPCWCSTREVVGVFGHRRDIFRTDHVRRWGRTDHRAAPTQGGPGSHERAPQSG